MGITIRPLCHLRQTVLYAVEACFVFAVKICPTRVAKGISSAVYTSLASGMPLSFRISTIVVAWSVTMTPACAMRSSPVSRFVMLKVPEASTAECERTPHLANGQHLGGAPLVARVLLAQNSSPDCDGPQTPIEQEKKCMNRL